MKPKLLSVLVASLFVPALAQGQEPQKELSGSISVGVREVRNTGNDPSKFTEYRDLPYGTSGFAGMELRHRGDNNYMNLFGENIGRDDQYMNIDGGRYGGFKYRLYQDNLRHNFGSGPGAKTPYFGVGSATLTATLPSLNPSTWNTFNHSYKRRDTGGFLELQAMSPWYFRVDANEVKREGINVFAGAKGTSPGNGFMDLPAPIDYTTQNLSGEVGYSSRRSHFALNLSRSTFDNGNNVLRWQNDFFGNGMDTTVLPPDNELRRLALNGNIRGLGLDSTLAGRYTYSTLTNDVAIQQTMLSTGGANPATNPSDPNFKGDFKRQTLGLSLASRPGRNLDTRLFYNYDKLKNDSTDVTFNPVPGTSRRGGSGSPIVNCNAGTVSATNPTGIANPCAPEMFHYTKKQFGLEAGYRLAREQKVMGGAEFSHTDRERADFPKTKERRFFGEYKAGFTESLTGRVRYQYLQRRSDFEAHPDILAANPMDLYVRRFDFANSNQHLLKLVFDQSLAGRADLGLEFLLKRNKYPDTPLGRTRDDRQELYASVGWGDPSAVRFLVFGDVEYVKYDSNHRADSTNTGNPDPSAPPTATAYNWTARNQDKSWQVGAGVDWAARPRFKVKTSALYAETNGSADFNVQPGGSTAVFLPINNFDNTKRFSFVVKGVYDVSRSLELTGGYSYENYKFSDIGYDNTKYVAGTGTSAAYTTGQFAFQPYSVNLFFGMAKLKF